MKSTFAAVAFFTALAGSQVINPTTVPIATRNQWCVSQKAACPSLCAQQDPEGSMATASNTCEPRTLDYSCVCASGLSPNATEYSQTIPYFMCTEFNTQCVASCGQNNACASSCREDNPCGARDPTRVNTSTISSSATATSSATGTGDAAAETTGFDTFGGSGSQSGDSNNNNNSGGSMMSPINIAQTYGFIAVVGGLFAGFGFML